MKKITALLLALLLTLSGTLALAEEAAAAFPAITITDEVDIDRQAAKELMAAFGVEEGQISLADSVLAILAAATNRLTIADGGVQYDLSLNGTNALSLAGELTEEGISIASTLFPSYVLNISSETVQKAVESLISMAKSSDEDGAKLPPEVLAAAQGYAEEFLNTVMASVEIGEAETGEYTFEDVTFNTKVPVQVDSLAIVQAAKTFIEQLESDETIAAAIQSAENYGVNLDVKEKLPEELTEENVPAIALTGYMNVDENGTQTGAMYGVAEITEFGKDAPTATVSALVDDAVVQARIEVPEQQTSAVFTLTPGDNGFKAQADVYVQEAYFGADLALDIQDDIVFTSDLYVLDAENPLVSEVLTVAIGEGERTLDVTGGEKTALSAETLISGEDSTAATGLMMDVLMNGLGGVMSTLGEAVPEAASVLNMLGGGAADDAANDAA